MQTGVTLNTIPSGFLEWLASSRINFLNEMREGNPMRYFSAHLPVMSTWNSSSPFPVNMTVKGIGLIPRTEHLQSYTDVFESVIAEASAMPWDESLYKRIEAMHKLYGYAGHFDPALLGGLEIFGGKTLGNLRENPSASLLYAGMMHTAETMQYISFQVNGEVEILDRENPYYRFLLASRKLFEFDRFHIYQPDYPWGYLIKVIEARDKSPWSKNYKHEQNNKGFTRTCS
ncbi:MAG: hypothetical protein AABY42_02580 [Nitrospirota bacterium]